MTTRTVTPRQYQVGERLEENDAPFFKREKVRDIGWYQTAARRYVTGVCRRSGLVWSELEVDAVRNPAFRHYRVYISFSAVHVPGLEPGTELQLEERTGLV